MRTDANAAAEPRFPGLYAVGVAIVAAALVWQRYHSSAPDPQALAPTDLANYYYPLADLVGRRLAVGDLPLWDPASCSGIPLLATLQPAVLYPFTWLSAVLPTADALSWALWAQVILAAAFAALALRAGGLHWAAAGLGGVFYAHACLLGNLIWPPSVATMTWLPLLWLCLEKLTRAMHFGWWAALCGATGLQLLAGFPQYLVYGFYWLIPYAGVLLYLETPPGERARRAAWIVAAFALGVGLAGAQLIPTAELAAESSRGVGVTVDDVHYLDRGTLPVRRVIENLFDPRPKNPTFDLLAGTGYLGVASLLSIAAMLALRARSPRTVFLVASALLALLLSDGFRGIAGPLFRVYHELPTGGLFRTPERLRFIFMISLIALASGGLDALLRYQRRRWPIALLLALSGALAAVFLLGGPGVGWRAAVSAALVLILLVAPPKSRLRGGGACAWVAFVVVDLWLATAPAGVLHAYPRELSEQYHAAFRKARISNERLAELQATPKFARVATPGFFPFHAAGPAYGLHRSACYEPLAPAQWRTLSEVLSPERALRGGLANPNPDVSPSFYDVAAVSTIVRLRRGVAVDHNDDALPRAYHVTAARQATQPEAFRHIRDGSFDFHSGVLLEGDVTRSAGDRAPHSPARIVSHEPERVEIDLPEVGAGWLVLADTFYPGWSAEIDGVEKPILRANGLYRAVRVETGDHSVVFRYQPTSYRVGAAVSLASLALMLGIAVAGTRGRI
jgi:hypothetical protein